jgi:hypothetical protein
VQLVADTHEATYRLLSDVPGGLGVDWIVQVLPFQYSAKVRRPELPTAMQLAAEAHETPSSPLPVVLLGVDWMAHVLPFQCTAKGESVFFWYQPTAVQLVGEGQEIAARPVVDAPDWWGTGWMAHVLPFQCSTKGTQVPELLV